MRNHGVTGSKSGVQCKLLGDSCIHTLPRATFQPLTSLKQLWVTEWVILITHCKQCNHLFWLHVSAQQAQGQGFSLIFSDWIWSYCVGCLVLLFWPSLLLTRWLLPHWAPSASSQVSRNCMLLSPLAHCSLVSILVSSQFPDKSWGTICSWSSLAYCSCVSTLMTTYVQWPFQQFHSSRHSVFF